MGRSGAGLGPVWGPGVVPGGGAGVGPACSLGSGGAVAPGGAPGGDVPFCRLRMRTVPESASGWSAGSSGISKARAWAWDEPVDVEPDVCETGAGGPDGCGFGRRASDGPGCRGGASGGSGAVPRGGVWGRAGMACWGDASGRRGAACGDGSRESGGAGGRGGRSAGAAPSGPIEPLPPVEPPGPAEPPDAGGTSGRDGTPGDVDGGGGKGMAPVDVRATDVLPAAGASTDKAPEGRDPVAEDAAEPVPVGVDPGCPVPLAGDVPTDLEPLDGPAPEGVVPPVPPAADAAAVDDVLTGGMPGTAVVAPVDAAVVGADGGGASGKRELAAGGGGGGGVALGASVGSGRGGTGGRCASVLMHPPFPRPGSCLGGRRPRSGAGRSPFTTDLLRSFVRATLRADTGEGRTGPQARADLSVSSLSPLFDVFSRLPSALPPAPLTAVPAAPPWPLPRLSLALPRLISGTSPAFSGSSPALLRFFGASAGRSTALLVVSLASEHRRWAITLRFTALA